MKKSKKKSVRKVARKKIVRNRDKSWVKKMVAGKIDYAMKPSRLRMARMKKRLSQDAVAKPNELSATTYGDIERGKRLVKKGTAQRLAAQLGGNLNALFREQGNKYLARRA